MRNVRPVMVRNPALFIIFFAISLIDPRTDLRSRPPEPETSKIIMDHELIRNGDFSLGETGWDIDGTGSGIQQKRKGTGDRVLALRTGEGRQAESIHILNLPFMITTATVSFEYRMLPYREGSGQFYAGITSATATLASLLITPLASKETGWQKVDVTLNAAVVAKIQAAHNAGQILYLTFTMVQNRTDTFSILLDNVSFRVSGRLRMPASNSKIAFIGTDQSGDSASIKYINIGSRTNYPKTLWIYSGRGGQIPRIFDLDWSPDGRQLAFCSNHESGDSTPYSALYTINADGSGLRRLTPSAAVLKAERCLITDTCWRPGGQEICYCRNGSPFITDGEEKAGNPGPVPLFGGISRACDLSWSMRGDRLLYRNDDFTRRGIYITTAGGGTGTQLVSAGGTAIRNPVWLPDESGFIFIHNSNIYQYLFEGRLITALTHLLNEKASHPSLSPDGTFIVFERSTVKHNPERRDLWILNRLQPNEMWPLTDNGRSSHPVWEKTFTPQ